MTQQRFTVFVELITKLYDPELHVHDDGKDKLTADDCAGWVINALGDVSSAELAPNIDSVHENVWGVEANVYDLIDQMRAYLIELNEGTFDDAYRPHLKMTIDEAEAVLNPTKR